MRDTEAQMREVCRLAEEGRYDDALDRLLEVGRATELSIYFLTLKAMLGTMTSRDHGYEVADAEADLKKALSIDSDYVDALIQLGAVHLEFHNDAQQARRYFERAVEVSRRQLTEAVCGLVECLYVTDGKAAAVQYLEGVLAAPMDTERIARLREEIESGEIGASH